MKIGIDASRAFLHERTGVEEYSYQLIKHLRTPLAAHDVVLYVRRGTVDNVDFSLPSSWRVKQLWAPRLWTYLRLSWELLIHRVDAFLSPSHIVPPIHPRHTVSIIHGLEYEHCPEAYSAWEKLSMRIGIKKTCTWSRWIVAVSNNTKRDLMELYGVSKKKIRVVYEGVNASAPEKQHPTKADVIAEKGLIETPYFLFIGRIEQRKNVAHIIRAFDLCKQHFNLPHQLILAGKLGHGNKEVERAHDEAKFHSEIVMPGFISEKKKFLLLKHADAFLFPSHYEGFGLPILEAQSMNVPVITADNSSLREVGAQSVIYASTEDAKDLAQKMYDLVDDANLRDGIIKKGQENIERFSWTRAAKLVATVVLAGKKG